MNELKGSTYRGCQLAGEQRRRRAVKFSVSRSLCGVGGWVRINSGAMGDVLSVPNSRRKLTRVARTPDTTRWLVSRLDNAYFRAEKRTKLRANVCPYICVQQLAFWKTTCARHNVAKRACILSISLYQEARSHSPVSLKLRFRRAAAFCYRSKDEKSSYLSTLYLPVPISFALTSKLNRLIRS